MIFPLVTLVYKHENEAVPYQVRESLEAQTHRCRPLLYSCLLTTTTVATDALKRGSPACHSMTKIRSGFLLNRAIKQKGKVPYSSAFLLQLLQTTNQVPSTPVTIQLFSMLAIPQLHAAAVTKENHDSLQYTHIHTHIHIYIYIYTYIYIYIHTVEHTVVSHMSEL